MPLANTLYVTKLVDNQTKREVMASSLTSLSMNGWHSFFDTQYTSGAPLTLPEGVETRLLFDRGSLDFVQEDYRPRIGNQFFDLWDFDNNVIHAPEDAEGTVYSLRAQAFAKAATAGTGIGCELVIRIPSGIAIERKMYTMLKGTDSQRLDWTLKFYVTKEDVDRGFELYFQPYGADIDVWGYNLLIQSGS